MHGCGTRVLHMCFFFLCVCVLLLLTMDITPPSLSVHLHCRSSGGRSCICVQTCGGVPITFCLGIAMFHCTVCSSPVRVEFEECVQRPTAFFRVRVSHKKHVVIQVLPLSSDTICAMPAIRDLRSRSRSRAIVSALFPFADP